MSAYPVTFDLERPESMSRAHVFLRILLLILASWIVGSGGWILIVSLGLPAVAAIRIAQKGGERYLSEDGGRVTGFISFVVGVLAYMALLTDELPGGERKSARLEIARSGTPTVASALLRILKAIPSAIVLGLLGVMSWVVSIIAVISILLRERYPERLWNYQRGVIRWQARLLGYLSSLAEPYPPFSLDTGPVSDTAPGADASALGPPVLGGGQ